MDFLCSVYYIHTVAFSLLIFVCKRESKWIKMDFEKTRWKKKTNKKCRYFVPYFEIWCNFTPNTIITHSLFKSHYPSLQNIKSVHFYFFFTTRLISLRTKFVLIRTVCQNSIMNCDYLLIALLLNECLSYYHLPIMFIALSPNMTVTETK